MAEMTAMSAEAMQEEIRRLSEELCAAKKRAQDQEGLIASLQLAVRAKDEENKALQGRMAGLDMLSKAHLNNVICEYSQLIAIIAAFAGSARRAGLSLSPYACLRPGSVPQISLDDGRWDAEELRAWVRRVFAVTLSAAEEVMRLREKVYGPSGELSADSEDEDGEQDPAANIGAGGRRIMSKLDKERKLQKSICRHWTERDAGVSALQRAADRIKKNDDALKRDMARLEKLDKEAAEKAKNPGNPENPQNPQNPENAGAAGSHEAAGESGAGERRKKQKRRRPRRSAAARCVKEMRYAEVFAELSRSLFYDPVAGKVVLAHPLPSQDHVFEVYSSAMAVLRTIKMHSVEVQQDGAGFRFALNAATWPVPCGVLETGEKVTLENDFPPEDFGRWDYPLGPLETLPPEFALAREGAKLNEEEKAKRCALGWPPALIRRLLWYKGRLMFDPLFYDGRIGGLYDLRPLYVGSRFSQAFFCTAVCMYSEGLMAKRRVKDLIKNIAGGRIAAGTLIDGINKFARVIGYPAYKAIRAMFLERVRVAHADETPIRIAEGARPKETRKAYLWSLTSGEKERDQLALFYGAASRAAPEFMRMAGIDPGGDPPKDASCALEYLICDAYSGYEAATETFEKCFGRPLTLQLCWVHAYRRLRDEIVRMGLYKAYITAIGDFDYRHFDDNLKAWFDARPKQTRPDSLIWRFLDLAMLVSNLSAMEESAKDDSPEEILEYRREEVAGVVDAIFSTAKNIAEDPRSHITYKYDREHDLFYSCRASDSAGWTGAICYLLNGEARLRTFLLDGSVSISNSLAERSLRPSAVHRNTSFIYKTMTGHQASAVLETLRMTCKLNGVSFPDYLCWLTTEVKFRCEERRLKSGITFQTFTAPPEPVEEITHDDGEKEKVRFSLFDDRYHCVTDDIPTEGLTPVDYLACRLRRANLDLPPEEDED